ncbi:basic proline-rich protein-like [Ictidomys tridecemlineatus]|uniref:basic proline-rich protein-like n=1 Tax=Ictidomys tridecemlineatus TaxID=43179 RepID=UPI00038BC367|nr:basic proline-rich protein-like [Ictidomys tridecemlineatus]KAG3280870.1 basic proline-rich protein-like [Ictidomys tridecemlineatus]
MHPHTLNSLAALPPTPFDFGPGNRPAPPRDARTAPPWHRGPRPRVPPQLGDLAPFTSSPPSDPAGPAPDLQAPPAPSYLRPPASAPPASRYVRPPAAGSRHSRALRRDFWDGEGSGSAPLPGYLHKAIPTSSQQDHPDVAKPGGQRRTARAAATAALQPALARAEFPGASDPSLEGQKAGVRRAATSGDDLGPGQPGRDPLPPSVRARRARRGQLPGRSLDPDTRRGDPVKTLWEEPARAKAGGRRSHQPPIQERPPLGQLPAHTRPDPGPREETLWDPQFSITAAAGHAYSDSPEATQLAPVGTASMAER